MVRLWYLLGLLFLATASAWAQPAPIIDRPPDFSQIVGKYAIQVEAIPTQVHVEEAITLHIRITGEGPEKYEPKREHLRLFPASWDNDFYVQEMRDEHQAMRSKKTWLFVYRLKPKHTKIDAIDGIKLVSYDPRIPGKKKYVTRYAERIPIDVKPKPDLTSQMEVPIFAAPDSFYECVDAEEVGAGAMTPATVSTWRLGLVLAGPPLICLLGVYSWRRCCPDATARARRLRSQAARHALAQLQAGGASAWSIVHCYLQERYDFNVTDPTPADVAVFLKRRGFAKALCGQGRAFFQACDAVRFSSGAAPEPKPLADAAMRLIAALEADPCVRG